jgi:hypothetical protein
MERGFRNVHRGRSARVQGSSVGLATGAGCKTGGQRTAIRQGGLGTAPLLHVTMIICIRRMIHIALQHSHPNESLPVPLPRRPA